MAALQIPSRCLAGLGPSLFANRIDSCKICQTEISSDEMSLTHLLDPCYTAFHAACLTEWFKSPIAWNALDTFNSTGKKEPSCPNCRGSLGEVDTPPRDHDGNEREMHIDVRHETFVLQPHAYPIQSLDELREIVGDFEFTRQPLADRRLPRPIRYDEIPIEQRNPAPALATGINQQADAAADFPWLVDSTNSIPSTGDPREDILSLFPPAESVIQTVSSVLNPPPSAIAVRDLLHNNLRSLGITNYEAYHFSAPSLIDTTFYIPIHATIAPLRSLTHLRSILLQDRAFHDPTFTGRWLRPTVYSTLQIREVVGMQRARDGLNMINDVMLQLPDEMELEGWALYLPSSIDRYGLLYAVPVVSTFFSPASTPTSEASLTDSEYEEGEIVTGLLCDGGVVDMTQYWPPVLTPTERSHLYGFEVDASHQHEMEVALYDRAFEMEVLNLRSGGDGNDSLPQMTEEDEEAARLLQEFSVTAAQFIPQEPVEIVRMEDEYDEPLTPSSAALVAALAPYESGAA